MKKLFYIALNLWVLGQFGNTAQAQLQVSSALSNNDLAQSLVGQGVIISNVSVNCAPGAYGSFDGTASNLGLDEGLLLTTGKILNAIGPNNDDGSVNQVQGINGTPGDPQLDILANATTFDACIFEFDIKPFGDTIRFDFSFASEEYLEYVGLGVNDVFAFFISGPDPSGGSYINRNIAVIPGTNTPISVDNVNNVTNSQYYVDNGHGNPILCTFFPIPPCTDPTVIQYDGFTKDLFAIAGVVPCENYHLKLAIADATDRVYDSGVFIEKIESNVDFVDSITFSNNIPYAIEGCNDVVITLTRSFVDNNPLTINFLVGGTATQGVDYQPIGNSVTIPAGQASADINLVTIADGIAEPVEEVIIYLSGVCTGVALDTIVIQIVDSLIINTTGDTLVCAGNPVGLSVSGANAYTWSPAGSLDFSNVANPVATPVQTTTYTVTGTSGACVGTGSVTVEVIAPASLFVTADTGICLGDTVQLEASGGVSYSWSPSNTLDNPNISNPVAFPSSTTTYYVDITDSCSNVVTDSVTVSVLSIQSMSFTGLAASYCSSDLPADLIPNPQGGTFYGTGVTGNQFDPGMVTLSGPYTVSYTVDFSGCQDTVEQTTDVTVIPDFSFSGLDSLYCETDPLADLVPDIQGGTFLGEGITGSQFDPGAVPFSGSYIIAYAMDFSGCLDTIYDTTSVLQLGNLSFDLLPEYCQSDAVWDLNPNPPGGIFSGDGVNGMQFVPGLINSSGQYTISYIINASGCADTLTQSTQLTVVPAPTFSGLQQVYCETDAPSTLIPVPAGGIFFGTGVTGSQFDPALALAGGPYTVSYAINSNGCKDTVEAQTQVNAFQTLSFTGLDPTYCEDDPASTLMPNIPGGIFSGPGIIGNQFDPALINAGNQLMITYALNDGCSDTASANTVVVTAPNVAFSGLDTSYCEKDSVITILPNPTGGIFSGPGITGDQFSILAAGNGSHVITYSFDTLGCTATSDFVVTVSPLPIVNAGEDVTISVGESTTLHATTGTSGNVQFFWEPSDDLDCLNCPDPVASPVSTATFGVVANLNGCTSDPDYVTITVIDMGIYFIPSGFSPNNDGVNDLFQVVRTKEIDVLEFKIFTRWGQLVHNDPNVPWNGTFKGDPLPIGTYTYVAVVKQPTFDNKTISGTVTLVR